MENLHLNSSHLLADELATQRVAHAMGADVLAFEVKSAGDRRRLFMIRGDDGRVLGRCDSIFDVRKRLSEIKLARRASGLGVAFRSYIQKAIFSKEVDQFGYELLDPDVISIVRFETLTGVERALDRLEAERTR